MLQTTDRLESQASRVSPVDQGPAGERLARPLDPETEATAVIADQQPLVLEGLTHLLRSCAIDVVDRCTSGAQLLDSLTKHRPHLALFDVRLDALDGLTVAREVRRRGMQVPIILITAPLDDDELLEGVQLGIRGLVAKAAPLDVLAQCVRTVLAGGTCLDQSLVTRALDTLLTRQAALRELAQVLTAREIQIFQMTVAGKRARQTAESLCVSEGTIKVHLHHIYDKLEITGRNELIAYARERGVA